MAFVYSIVIDLETQELAEKGFQYFQTGVPVTNHKPSRYNETLSDDSKFTNLSRAHPYSIITELQSNTTTTTRNKMKNEKNKMISEYLGHGIIRLFKNENLTVTDTGNDDDEDNERSKLTIPGDDTMICILFVPTYFTIHDLLHFYIGDDIVNNQITNFRILQNHDSRIGFNFMVLMKFKDPIDAKHFQDTFNGKKFSKIDPERCHVVFIKEVVFQSNLFDQNDECLPYLVTDPFTKLPTSAKTNQTPIELPVCPVCLERMDSETTGLITIPCQHTFHCRCLDAWKNSKCPVCRYSSFRLTRDSLIKKAGHCPRCSTCGYNENLWICLICGNIGCGRYNSKHAIQHYEDTSHCFAMDMKSQRVWDYAGDNYVHRIVQNEVDGKLVEVTGSVIEGSSSSSSGQRPPNGSSETSKNDKDFDLAETFLQNKEYHLEYVQVLISQLESQREYYEDKISTLESQMERSDDSTKGNDDNNNNDKKRVEDRINEAEALMVSETKRLDRIEATHEGVKRDNLELSKQNIMLKKDMKVLKDENINLKDQIKDLMFYMETRDKFEGASSDAINGTVVIQSESTKKRKKKKKKKKSKVAGTCL